jgi:hypothetical protein
MAKLGKVVFFLVMALFCLKITLPCVALIDNLIFVSISECVDVNENNDSEKENNALDLGKDLFISETFSIDAVLNQPFKFPVSHLFFAKQCLPQGYSSDSFSPPDFIYALA